MNKPENYIVPNKKQKRFAELYCSDVEFFGNGVQAYVEAYNIDQSKPNWYKTAKAAASRLLTNVNLLYYMDQLLESDGLNDAFVDKQIRFLITQCADFGAKMAAIKEYNNLRSRITKKMDVTTGGEPIMKQVYVLPDGTRIEF